MWGDQNKYRGGGSRAGNGLRRAEKRMNLGIMQWAWLRAAFTAGNHDLGEPQFTH